MYIQWMHANIINVIYFLSYILFSFSIIFCLNVLYQFIYNVYVYVKYTNSIFLNIAESFDSK